MNRKRKVMTMNSVIRRQGGAVVITIPPAFLKLLDLDIGSRVELSVEEGGLLARPVTHSVRKGYSAAELLKGSEHVAELNTETSWAREGDAVGREIT
jgi:antitoxin ChpS